MSLRGIVVLALVLVAALVAVFWGDRPPARQSESAGALGTILDGPVDAVSALETAEGKARMRIERRDDHRWAVVTPFEADADPREVEAFLRGLEGARVVRVAAAAARDAGAFGLDAAATVVRIERRDGHSPRVVRIGRHSPVGPERYVSLGDRRVLLADFGGASVERAPDSFRERRLIPAEAAEIRRIVIDRPSGRLALARDGITWSLVEPVKDLAEFAAADGLARSVSTLSFSRFLPAGPPRGVPEPIARAEVEISIDGARGSMTAEIAPADRGRERLARRDHGGWMGVVGDADVQEVLRDPQEFREHRPLLFSTPDVRGVRIEGDGIRLAATRERDGGAWAVHENGGPAVEADGAKIDQMVDRLRWLRATRVTGAPSRAFATRLAIEITGEGRILGQLELDRVPPVVEPIAPEAAPGETSLARSSWRPGCVLEIPVSQLSGLPRRASDLTPAAAAAGGERKP